MKRSNALFKMFALIGFLFCNQSYAHQSGASYLNISIPDANMPQQYSAEWKIMTLDIELALGLDSNLDGKIVWGEILANRARIEQFAESGIQLSQNGTLCPLTLNDIKVDSLNSGLHLVSSLTFNCNESSPPTLTYNPMLGFDSDHKGLVNITTTKIDQLFILDKDNDTALVSYENNKTGYGLFDFVLEGIWHIWIGYDHLLFLLALLLPSVLKRQGGKWSVQQEIRPVFVDVAMIVSTFTIAHSITLIAATLQWIELSTLWVEIVIAASVAIGGIALLIPIPRKRRWLFVFLFGLVHGFGFANVLRDLTQLHSSFWQGTLGFNIGVEIGQLLIVLILVPILYRYRSHYIYQRIALPLCALLMIGTGSFWVFERGFA